MANIIVRAARERQYAIVLERLGRRPAESMIVRVKDGQLRHRIFQASFKVFRGRWRRRQKSMAYQ